MGLDLTLLPVDSATPEHQWYSFTRIEVGRDHAAFNRIKEFSNPEPVPNGVMAYGDREYALLKEDARKTPLTWVFAGDLARSGLHGPAGAYVWAMDPEDKVVLYWH